MSTQIIQANQYLAALYFADAIVLVCDRLAAKIQITCQDTRQDDQRMDHIGLVPACTRFFLIDGSNGSIGEALYLLLGRLWC